MAKTYNGYYEGYTYGGMQKRANSTWLRVSLAALVVIILATSVIGPTNGAAIRTVCSGTVCLTAGWAGPHIGTPTGWNAFSTVELRLADGAQQ